MKIFETPGWVWYFEDSYYEHACEQFEWLKEKYPDREVRPEEVYDEDGKWLYYCKSFEYAERICSALIEKNLLKEAKHRLHFPEKGVGVCCFYLRENDIKAHKKLIDYLKRENLLQRNKDGSYRNIAFKTNFETQLGLYGEFFEGRLHLADIIDLKTGEWSEKVNAYEQKMVEYEQRDVELRELQKVAVELYGSEYGSYAARLRKDDDFNRLLVIEKMGERGISVGALAERIKVTERTVKGWLKGKNKPNVLNAIAIGRELGIESLVIIRTKGTE